VVFKVEENRKNDGRKHFFGGWLRRMICAREKTSFQVLLNFLRYDHT